MNKKKILIVEDDPFSQKFYEIIFNRIGHEPMLVHDYEELFGALKKNSIDLLVMDINLKNAYIKDVQHDGRSLAKIIRDNPDYRNIPIVMITGFFSKIMKDELINNKIVDYIITKPIDNLNQFINIINSYLE